MRYLPGKQRPNWLVMATKIGSVILLCLALISTLPIVLMMSLITALALIPAIRQVRKEMHRTGLDLEFPLREQMVDITPIHRRLIREFWPFRKHQR